MRDDRLRFGRQPRVDNGMTLVEITFALLLVVLVASYAVPTYREYIARGHRQMAIDALHATALDIELVGGYGGEAGGRALSDAGHSGTSVATADRRGIPANGRPIYRLRIERAAASSSGPLAYVISAEPIADGPQANDRCGVFFLDASGLRGNRTRGDGDASREDAVAMPGCWQGR